MKTEVFDKLIQFFFTYIIIVLIYRKYQKDFNYHQYLF